MIPARIDGTPNLVWSMAVTKPARAPDIIATGIPRKGCPAAAHVTDTAAPRTKHPSVVRSAILSILKLRKRARGTGAYKKPSSKAVLIM